MSLSSQQKLFLKDLIISYKISPCKHKKISKNSVDKLCLLK